MNRPTQSLKWYIYIVICGLLVSQLPACAVLNSPAGTTDQVHEEAKKLDIQTQVRQSYWWFVRAKMAWPEEQEPAWHMDALLARQIFKPLLLEHAQDIEMWRFHRRAAHDKAGHQFSFIFYTKQSIAEAILNKLTENTLIQKLIAEGKVETISLHDANKKPDPAIEATSDKNWSLEMQKAWPYYAMGVSQLWLSLIDQHVASTLHNGENQLNENNVNELIEFYRQINNKLIVTWENEGGHALLHHLNALFGYGEISVYERRLMRF